MDARGYCRHLGFVVCVLQVFFVTTASSIFAYLWLVLILTQFSENIVTFWEALLTFLFFPVLVITAYLTDKGCFRRSRPRAAGTEDEEQPEKPDGNAETGFCKRYDRYDTIRDASLTCARKSA